MWRCAVAVGTRAHGLSSPRTCAAKPDANDRFLVYPQTVAEFAALGKTLVLANLRSSANDDTSQIGTGDSSAV